MCGGTRTFCLNGPEEGNQTAGYWEWEWSDCVWSERLLKRGGQSVPRQLSWPFCCRDSCVKAWIYSPIRFEDYFHWSKSPLKKPVPVWCWVVFSPVVNFEYPGYGYMAAYFHLSTASTSNCPSAGPHSLVLRISRLLPLVVPSPTIQGHNRSSVGFVHVS